MLRSNFGIPIKRPRRELKISLILSRVNEEELCANLNENELKKLTLCKQSHCAKRTRRTNFSLENFFFSKKILTKYSKYAIFSV